MSETELVDIQYDLVKKSTVKDALKMVMSHPMPHYCVIFAKKILEPF